ncbi:hypothetical protein E2C01_009964 [Portunus trituberculatus]|uniref:Uncharacterized protein n=1 Tax=Portunus trituberculatus TaxID=210409 RepID=A0A5B7D7E2_PORTR|nr:hypothetical protein [Portunus trituberculatus]
MVAVKWDRSGQWKWNRTQKLTGQPTVGSDKKGQYSGGGTEQNRTDSSDGMRKDNGSGKGY